DSCLLELRGRSCRLHRPARFRTAIRAIHSTKYFRAPGNDACNVRSTIARFAEANDVERLRSGFGRRQAVRIGSSRTGAGRKPIGHGGDLIYFHSDMHLVLDKGLGFFVSYNSSGKGDLDPRAPLWQAFLDRYCSFLEPNSEAPGKQTADSVAGKYLASRRAQTT